MAGNPDQECLYIGEDRQLFIATVIVYRGPEGTGIGVPPVSDAEAVMMLAEQGEFHSSKPLNAKEARDWLEHQNAPEWAYEAAGLRLRKENDMTRDTSDYLNSPLLGRVYALEQFVALLTGTVSRLNDHEVDRLGELAEKIRDMDKSGWRMNEFQQNEFDDTMKLLVLGTKGKFPIP